MYIPSTMARASIRYRADRPGMGELVFYDYMGTDDFDPLPVGDSNNRTQVAIANGEPFSLVALSAAPRTPALANRAFRQGQRLYALLRTSQLASYGASLNDELQNLFDGKRSIPYRMHPEGNYALWHDIKNDVYFSPNPTFLNLLYSIMSRPTDFAQTVDQSLRIGDPLRLAVVLNGRSVKSVTDMHVKVGRVSAILPDAIRVSDTKPYRMPYIYILTHELEITEAPK